MKHKNDRATLAGQLKTVRLLTENEMDLRTWEILLIIALEEGEGAVHLAEKYNISKSAFSRHVLYLCGQRAHKGNKKEVPDVLTWSRRLVEKRENPENLRSHALHITPTGRKLIADINAAMMA